MGVDHHQWQLAGKRIDPRTTGRGQPHIVRGGGKAGGEIVGTVDHGPHDRRSRNREGPRIDRRRRAGLRDGGAGRRGRCDHVANPLARRRAGQGDRDGVGERARRAGEDHAFGQQEGIRSSITRSGRRSAEKAPRRFLAGAGGLGHAVGHVDQLRGIRGGKLGGGGGAVRFDEGEVAALGAQDEIGVQGLRRIAAIFVRGPDDQVTACRQRHGGKLPFRFERCVVGEIPTGEVGRRGVRIEHLDPVRERAVVVGVGLRVGREKFGDDGIGAYGAGKTEGEGEREQGPWG